jgi:hypothetical protein
MVEGSAAGAIGLAAIGAVLAVISPFLFALAVAAFGVELPLRSAVEIGRDGVLITGVGRRKFVSYPEVKRVACTVYGAIIFTMRSGEEVVANAGSPERAAFLLKRIERCRQPGSEISESEARRTLLEDHRSLAERLPELRQLGRTSDASYREASVPREQLWRIVEDTGLEASTRVGAAVALSGELPEPERARLRVVAEGTASPRTRVALEEVAADTTDDERLGEVLGELEAEERARRETKG